MQKAFSLVELSSLASGRVPAERAVTQGFSLVELSIVLVILGLLTGGILAGQNLIRAAELRAVTSEFDRYTSAVHTFRDKYFAIPGDFRDATKFWGRLVSAGHCATNSAAAVATPGACDGDGDGNLERSVSGSQAGENYGFWQQLAHAGLIEGTYTGIAGSNNGVDADIGVNVPRSKMTNAGWSALYRGTSSGDSAHFDGDYGNGFIFGREDLTTETDDPVLKPEEAWNVDTKVDDGMPAQGKVSIFTRVACTVQSNGSAITNSAAHAALMDAEYNLTNSAVACALLFRRSF